MTLWYRNQGESVPIQENSYKGYVHDVNKKKNCVYRMLCDKALVESKKSIAQNLKKGLLVYVKIVGHIIYRLVIRSIHVHGLKYISQIDQGRTTHNNTMFSSYFIQLKIPNTCQIHTFTESTDLILSPTRSRNSKSHCTHT